MDLDRRLLRLLQKRGSNMRKPHAIEFYVYFKTKTGAGKARARLRKAGFHVELLADSSGRRWLCLSILEMPPAWGAIQSVKRRLNRLVKPFGGYCDGWGTQMEK